MKNQQLYKQLTEYIHKFRIDDNNFIDNLVKNSDFKKSDFTYGTTPYETAITLFKKIKKKPKRCVVIGASVGWMSFYWNELYGEIPTIGVDIHKGRIDYGNKLIKEHNLKNIELVVDDLYTFKFNNDDVIWMSNLCFEQQKLNEIFKKIITENPNITIISYRPIFFNRHNVSNFKFPVSWGEQNFYIYEKI